MLQIACKEEEQRIIAGREQTIGAAMAIERQHLQPLPAEGFDLAAVSFPKVNGSGCSEHENFSCVMSAKVPKRKIPALLTSTSSLPKAVSSCLNSLSTSEALNTSAPIATASPPLSMMA
jgi:hypothetical protein